MSQAELEAEIALPENDEISVKEIQMLMKKVEDFYASRPQAKMNIVWLATLILKRLMNDRDYFLNIEGNRGSGKSNFILLLSLIQARYSGIWRNKETGKLVKVLPRLTPLSDEWEHIKFGFAFRRNMSFLDEAEAVKLKFNGLDRYMPFIIDEGSKNLHKYEWNSKLQFLLVRMSDTERFQNKAVYVCFPNFKELNSAFRNDRIMMRAYIFHRDKKNHFASVILSLKDVNRFVTDPWHTDENSKKFEYILRRIPAALRTPEHILKAEKALAGYAGSFEVPDLEHIAPRIWDIYMRYKIYYSTKDSDPASFEEDTEKVNAKVIRWKSNTRRLLDYIMSKEPGIRNEKLQLITGLSKSSYLKFIRETKTPDKVETKFQD